MRVEEMEGGGEGGGGDRQIKWQVRVNENFNASIVIN